jgi:hypothetical protein
MNIQVYLNAADKKINKICKNMQDIFIKLRKNDDEANNRFLEILRICVIPANAVTRSIRTVLLQIMIWGTYFIKDIHSKSLCRLYD